MIKHLTFGNRPFLILFLYRAALVNPQHYPRLYLGFSSHTTSVPSFIYLPFL